MVGDGRDVAPLIRQSPSPPSPPPVSYFTHRARPCRCYRCKPKVKILINASKARTEERKGREERNGVSDRGFNGIRKCYVSNYEAVFSEFTIPCYGCNTFIPSPLRNSIKSIRAIHTRGGGKAPGSFANERCPRDALCSIFGKRVSHFSVTLCDRQQRRRNTGRIEGEEREREKRIPPN